MNVNGRDYSAEDILKQVFRRNTKTGKVFPVDIMDVDTSIQFEGFDNSMVNTLTYIEEHSNVRDWQSKLSKEQRRLIHQYTANPSSLTAEDKAIIHNSLLSFKLNSNMETIHGSSNTSLLGNENLSVDDINERAGQIRELSRLLSSGCRPLKSTEFNEYGRGVDFIMQIPKNKGFGAFISNISTNGGAELEYLINSGICYQIIGARKGKAKECPMIVTLRLLDFKENIK